MIGLECPLCYAEVAPEDVRRHVAELHAERLAVCPLCNEMVFRGDAMKHAEKQHLGRVLLECEACGEIVTPEEVDRHTADRHPGRVPRVDIERGQLMEEPPS